MVTSNPLPERLDEALVNVVADTGALEGKTIAILGNTDERNQLVTDTLAAHGYEVTDAVVTNQPTDDAVADAAELDVVIERWSSMGIDYVLDTTGLDRVLAAANRAGFEADWATNRGTLLSLSRFESGATEAEIARTVVVSEPQVEVIYESGTHRPSTASTAGTPTTPTSRPCSSPVRTTSTTSSASLGRATRRRRSP